MKSATKEMLTAWFMALLILGFLALLTHACFAQVKPKLIIKPVTPPDTITALSATWTIEQVLTPGDEKCIHQWRTVPGGEKRKDYGKDSLNTLYNPHGERTVREQCQKCAREIIKSETITERKVQSDYSKIKKGVK